MIALSIEELNMLKNSDVEAGIKNNFAAKKLNSDDLIICNQLAMDASAMLLSRYNEQETNEYQKKLAAANYSNSK